MSPRRSGWGTPAQLAGSFLIVAALLGVAWAGRPFRSEPVPTPPAPASIAAQARAVSAQEQRQEDRLRAEDARLLTLVGGLRPGSAPYVQTVDGVDTLVLTPRGIDYGTRDLIRYGAAEQQGGALLIRTNVLVAPDARLVVKAPGGQLRLRSENSGFWSRDLDRDLVCLELDDRIACRNRVALLLEPSRHGGFDNRLTERWYLDG